MNRFLMNLLGMLLLLFGSNNILADHAHEKLASPNAANGESLYHSTCVACHGNDGKGTVPGAPDLRGVDSRLVQKDIDTLLHNVDEGYQSSGSMMAMPPKGGSSNLSEQDLVDILDYMRKEFGGES